jgi:RNA polymerase sigma-70 factor (ECF subfamily)
LGALRVTRNAADAEDVRQEALLRAVSRLEQFSGTRNDVRDEFHAWISRIAVNASIDVLRKRRDSKFSSLDEPLAAGDEPLENTIAARDENPEERFARREMRQFFAEAIKQLSPELRQVCLLRDVLQYSTQEVADRLGISAIAVRLRLFRAHRRLRENLSAALSSKKKRCAPIAAKTGTPRRDAECARPLLPLGEFEYACGD